MRERCSEIGSCNPCSAFFLVGASPVEPPSNSRNATVYDIDTPILSQLGIWFSNIFNDWEGNSCSWSNFVSWLVCPAAFILRRKKKGSKIWWTCNMSRYWHLNYDVSYMRMFHFMSLCKEASSNSLDPATKCHEAAGGRCAGTGQQESCCEHQSCNWGFQFLKFWRLPGSWRVSKGLIHFNRKKIHSKLQTISQRPWTPQILGSQVQMAARLLNWFMTTVVVPSRSQSSGSLVIQRPRFRSLRPSTMRKCQDMKKSLVSPFLQRGFLSVRVPSTPSTVLALMEIPCCCTWRVWSMCLLERMCSPLQQNPHHKVCLARGQ